MLLSTPGIVLHTTPYSENSMVVKVFTRQLGLRSYIIKGVRGRRSRVKQNMLQPLTSLDMVVYDNPRTDLNYIKELALRHPERSTDAVANAVRFFMTEVLYKVLREDEPMPALFDYVEETADYCQLSNANLPITFLLNVSRHLGIEPFDNSSLRKPLFDLQEGCFVSTPSETTLPQELSILLHHYLSSFRSASPPPVPPQSLRLRRGLIDTLIAYFQLHLSGFRDFHSHEILHVVLK